MSGRSHDRQLVNVGREAALIADGTMPFPSDLDPEDTLRLAQAVRAIHRRQLLDWLAKEIARDLLEKSDGFQPRSTSL